jgi:hypothetical protein
MTFEEQLTQIRRIRQEQSDTLAVMAEIQRRQAEVQRLQAEETDRLRPRMAHIEATLAEVGAKLNGLIGFMEGFVKRPQ